MKIFPQRGFSLIELLVVMAIMGALIAIALPRYQGSVENARLTALKANLRAMRDSLGRHYEDRGRYPESLEALIEARYLKAVPVDPMSESAETWILIEDEAGELGGVVDVRSGAKGTTTEGVPYGDL